MEVRPNSRPLLSQTLNNTTLWIGHLSAEQNDHLAGQTFTSPADGTLKNIQVFSQSVPKPGHLEMTIHQFDCGSREWGPAIATAEMIVEKNDESSWIRFVLDPVDLKKNLCYGFRLQTPDAFIGLGEAASHAKNPFPFGVSWNGDGHNKRGEFYNFFSLAFKVEVA
jgi:hypothetical protein